MEPKHFNKILLMGRPGVEGAPETLLALKDYLLSLNAELLVEKNTNTMMGKHKLPVVTAEKIPNDCDLIVVVGGDGSLLTAAHIALPYNLPVLGINRGRLGFLTDIHPDELTKISAILSGHYREEKRFLLQTALTVEDKKINEDIALNDVVLLPGNLAQMIEFEIMVNGQFVCSQRADGMIVATPTGSTAYALSGGGPILHPALNAVVLVPMFPHTLSSRPIVISGDSQIVINICASNETSPYVSCDGQSRIALAPGGKIEIHKKPELLRLIHPVDYHYFNTLREKLSWEKHATRKKS
ncbi:MAG: NAD(+) kinase [Coxiellaceae bacterium]|nr:NAD(+) kinase [Coxiellaceae bacterium]